MVAQSKCAKHRTRPRKAPDGRDKVLYVHANQELLCKLNLLCEKRSKDGRELSFHVPTSPSIGWETVIREGLGKE